MHRLAVNQTWELRPGHHPEPFIGTDAIRCGTTAITQGMVYRSRAEAAGVDTICDRDFSPEAGLANRLSTEPYSVQVDPALLRL